MIGSISSYINKRRECPRAVFDNSISVKRLAPYALRGAGQAGVRSAPGQRPFAERRLTVTVKKFPFEANRVSSVGFNARGAKSSHQAPLMRN